jgi:hypothetical protein
MEAWMWAVIAAAVVIVAVVVGMEWVNKRRRRALRGQFGGEYDRTVQRADNRRQAERDLADRTRRRDELELRPLSELARERYEEQWEQLQIRFVDRPQVAVVDADELVTQVMRDRGYPVDDFAQWTGNDRGPPSGGRVVPRLVRRTARRRRRPGCRPELKGNPCTSASAPSC